MNKTVWGYYIVLTLLFCIGTVMVFGTTSARIIDHTDHTSLHYGLIKQFASAALSVLLAYAVYQLGYRQLINISPWLFYACIVLLILVFLPGLGKQINGAYRWLYVAHISLQPSELAKVICPLYYLYLLERIQQPLTFGSFCKMQLILCIPLILILLEPDNGTAAILLATFVVLYFLTAIPITYWAVPIFTLTLVCGVLAYNMPHVHDRIEHFLTPKKDILGKGHQPYQARIAVGSGGLFGKGLGESMQKYQYLPAAWSDYIAAIYAEEFGFIGIMGLLIAYTTLIVLGFSIALKAQDFAGYVLASIYTFTIALQTFLNLGVVSGVLPSKGINLPFFSQGGTSLLLSLIMVACILNIANNTKGLCES